MNGRVYEPTLGRFISADPNVDGVSDSQGYNRYSYVGNNPLGATDPTGYFSLKDAAKIVVVIVVAYFTAGAAVAALGVSSAGVAASGFAAGMQAAGFSTVVINGVIGGAAAGFASGFTGSLLNGGNLGDAFKAGVTGGVVGAVTGGIFGKISGMDLSPFERGLAHGVVHGGAAEAQGGEFRHGFYAGFLNGSIDGKIETTFRDSEAFQYAAAAAAGGTGSAIGGGKFENGAVAGAFSYMFNQKGGRLRVRGRSPAEAEAEALARMEARHGIVRVGRDLQFRGDNARNDPRLLAAAERTLTEFLRWRATLFGPFPEISGVDLAKLRREFNNMKPALWRTEAGLNYRKYSPEQLNLMKQGIVPMGWDGKPMEIHHNQPLQYGGMNFWTNFRFMTNSEHRSAGFNLLNHLNPNVPIIKK